MIPIKQHELRFLMTTQKVKEVRINEERPSEYSFEIEVDKIQYELHTQAGKKRLFKTLATVINFIKEQGLAKQSIKIKVIEKQK